ncbi:MAG: hypothetical protein L7F77_08665 [Candidatus Magnetominusculus sp. LBB02]|nr:hypothetical protein [Candidatus Magnetominusculus sp. LBB02]
MKRVLILNILFVFMLSGVSFGALITGEVWQIDKAKGMLSVKNQKIEVGFSCDGSMMKGIDKGDYVKVEYSVKDGSSKAASIVKMGNRDLREISGIVNVLDTATGYMVVQDKEVEIGLSCSGMQFPNVKAGDTVTVQYVVDGNGKGIVKDIKK